MFSFLSKKNEENRLMDTLSMLGNMNERIEILSHQILKDVCSDEANITVKLYESILDNDAFRDLGLFKIKPTPRDIIESSTLEDLVSKFNKRVYINDEKSGFTMYSTEEMSRASYNNFVYSYNEMRKTIENTLLESNISVDEYVSMFKNKK